jgi:hypothetical protein
MAFLQWLEWLPKKEKTSLEPAILIAVPQCLSPNFL